jgi:hypothetical protein
MPIAVETVETDKPINKATGAPHISPTVKSLRDSSVPINPYLFPPRINLEFRISSSLWNK